MKGFLRIAMGALLSLSAVSAAGQELELYVSADSVTVGERFFISVIARYDFAAAPQFPSPDTSGTLTFGDLEVLAVHSRQSGERAGARIDSVVYEVTTFALDTARVGSVPVLFTAGEDTFTVRTDSTWVPVVSLVPEGVDDIQDLAPLVEFPSARWPYAVAAVALLLLALLLALYLRRRRAGAPGPPAAPPVPPEREALERLDALEVVDLSIPENVQPFYDELSGLLRTYVGRRLHVRAMESTTRELMHELHRRGLPARETTRRLRSVLTASDFVKFADATPPPSQGSELIVASRAIVHDVERQLTPAKETPSTDATTGIQ